MIRIAVLSEQVTSQIREAVSESARELDSVQVVFSGTSADELRRRGRELRPQVLVLDLALLSGGYGSDPRQEIDSLLQSTGAELALVLYSFTRREVVQQLSSTRSRPIKAPISLATLRLNMLSLLVKDALRSSADNEAAGRSDSMSFAIPELQSSGGFQPVSPSRAEAELAPLPPRQTPFVPPPGSGASDPVPAAGMPKLFNQFQLGRLQEARSKVRCECPNHLSELVTSLNAFEEYSRKCENAGDDDAKLHGYLYQQTSRARRLMEEALLTLCRYERLDI
ncbi:MAG: hypothetical protein QM813_18850 [Verrucomicrobiota bacterium]